MEENGIISLPAETVQLITTQQAWHYRIIPVKSTPEILELITDQNNCEQNLIPELEILFGKKIHTEKVDSSVLTSALSKYYRKNSGATANSLRKKSVTQIQGEDFLATLISEAQHLNSSDIHLESYEDKCRIRIRIDGKLIERYVIPRTDYLALINKIKIKANLDIAEKRLPQDGRILFKDHGTQFDIRVSALPTLYGEKVVLRLLGNDASQIDVHQLGFSETDLENFLSGINRSSGIVLISGPTGSGKTTTLYAALRILNKESRNILTVEDPVEYTLEGINQVQMKESIGLTFSSTLRTFLRQDPDVIMLGEIRDSETAQMAIRAALTGHLVLSTIHTNSALGIISRLIDMGVPSYLVAATLNTVIAQRLVRLLCPSCKEEVSFQSPRTLGGRVFDAGEKHFEARGCEDCHFTGYRGRKAIYEVVPVDNSLAEVIRMNHLKEEDYKLFESKSSLKKSALGLFMQGSTSLAEVSDILNFN